MNGREYLLQRYLARGGTAIFSEPGRVNAVPFFTLLRQRGFTYEKTIQLLEWDGRHNIAIYCIRHRQAALLPSSNCPRAVPDLARLR